MRQNIKYTNEIQSKTNTNFFKKKKNENNEIELRKHFLSARTKITIII